MTIRNRDDYFGKVITATHEAKCLTATVFHHVDRFQLFNDRLLFTLPDWTQSAFENYGEKLGIFEKTYQLSGDEFQSLKNDNALIFQSITEMARTYCNAPHDAQFLSFELSVLNRTLEMSFIKNGESFDKSFYGETYNNLIIANVEESAQNQHPSLVETASTMVFSIAERLEPDYWSN